MGEVDGDCGFLTAEEAEDRRDLGSQKWEVGSLIYEVKIALLTSPKIIALRQESFRKCLDTTWATETFSGFLRLRSGQALRLGHSPSLRMTA
jgi:hypothetical protein